MRADAVRAHNVTIDGDYAAVDGLNVMILDMAQHRDTSCGIVPQPPGKHTQRAAFPPPQHRPVFGRADKKRTFNLERIKGHG